MDSKIRRMTARLPSIIVSGLSLYFAVVFGLGGAKALLLLHQGTTDYSAAALAQALGYAFGPSLAHVTAVAAAIGAAKLAVGGFFILAVTERSPATVDGEAQREYGALDLALHGAVALTLLQALPAWIGGDTEALRTHMANIMLICVAIGTSMFEREHATQDATRVGQLEATSTYRPHPDQPLPTGRAPLR
jgi:hypothetical protein